MSTQTAPSPTPTRSGGTRWAKGAATADVLVIFGITGDLAKVMTFHSLYRLEKHGLLNCPIVGVAVNDWTVDQLREHARESIAGTGETIDTAVFDRLAARLSYVSGDFADSRTYERVGQELTGKQLPVFYLEIPPFLFATVIKGLSDAGLTDTARIVVEKPFGHDLQSARDLAHQVEQYVREDQVYRIDHFLGLMGLEELVYLRFANVMLEPLWNRSYVSSIQITLAESFGVEDRGHFYDPVGALRDVVVNHLMMVLSAVAMETPSGQDPTSIKDGQAAVLKAIPTAEPAHYVRGQYDGYLDVDGVAPGSTTETYAAVRLDVQTWRWSGVPVLLRSGKYLAGDSAEVRLVFRQPPPMGFHALGGGRLEPDQLVIRLFPDTGIQIQLEAHPVTKPNVAAPIQLEHPFGDPGEGVPTPYEVLLYAAIVGDSTRFARRDVVEECWRIMGPLLDSPPPVHPYAKGTWGPSEADRLVAGHGRWQTPWVAS
jgi:glucose-6-phosphate 1-dehydrogenase